MTTECPPHPRESVDKISGVDDADTIEYYICSKCGTEFEGKYDSDSKSYIEVQNPQQ